MMFTKDQGQELIDNTTSEWTSINGVNGTKFTSKTDSSKYIFLPAAGEWWYSLSGESKNYYIGIHGSYWSTKFVLVETKSRSYVLIADGTPDYAGAGVSEGHSVRGIRPLEW